MHIFLTVLLWVFLVLLAVILLGLFLPAGVCLEYKEGQLYVKCRLFGFIVIPVYPFKQEQKEKAQSFLRGKKSKTQKTQTAKPVQKEKLKLSFDDVKVLLSSACEFMKRILRALHFSKIILIVPVHAEDAAKTALQCAEIQGAIGAASAFLNNFLDLKFECVHILPDFTGEIKAGPYFSCNVSALPIIMIISAVYALFRLKDLLMKKEKSADNAIKQTEVSK